MRWLVVVTLLVGCSGARVTSASGGASATMPGRATITGPARASATVPLCDLCSTPYDYQTKDVEKLLWKQCGGEFVIVEEGTRPSSQGVAVGVGMGVVATAQRSEYFWVAQCSGELRSDPPDPNAQRGWR